MFCCLGICHARPVEYIVHVHARLESGKIVLLSMRSRLYSMPLPSTTQLYLSQWRLNRQMTIRMRDLHKVQAGRDP
jgi:hypothetical protein